MIIERASLRPSQKILRGHWAPAVLVGTTSAVSCVASAKLFSPAHPLSADEAQAQWALLVCDGGQRILHLLCAYLDERVAFVDRWHGAVRDWDQAAEFPVGDRRSGWPPPRF